MGLLIVIIDNNQRRIGFGDLIVDSIPISALHLTSAELR